MLLESYVKCCSMQVAKQFKDTLGSGPEAVSVQPKSSEGMRMAFRDLHLLISVIRLTVCICTPLQGSPAHSACDVHKWHACLLYDLGILSWDCCPGRNMGGCFWRH